jgi:peptidoglycan/xylan/chitin deacetylase (PgdA/CDA1 family)
MYHGVTEGSSLYSRWTQLPVSSYVSQIRYLKKYYRVLPLSQVAESLRTQQPLPTYTAVITFDDGLKNNKTVAFPLLKRYKLPATIFLATGFINTERLLWPDNLFIHFQETKCKVLDLRNDGLGKQYLRTPKEKQAALCFIAERLKVLESSEKKRLYSIIIKALGEPKLSSGATDYHALSWSEVSEMYSTGLITFGGHTVNHEILSRLSDDSMRKEIRESCDSIQTKLIQDSICFAYPNGTEQDFNEYTKSILREEKILCGVTTIEGLNCRDEDLLALKRVCVGNDMTSHKFALVCAGFIPWLNTKLKQSQQMLRSYFKTPQLAQNSVSNRFKRFK